jgi:hypothetical protein
MIEIVVDDEGQDRITEKLHALVRRAGGALALDSGTVRPVYERIAQKCEVLEPVTEHPLEVLEPFPVVPYTGSNTPPASQSVEDVTQKVGHD